MSGFTQFSKGFYTNIENDTLKNKSFRKVVTTTPHMQVVLMSLMPGEQIGSEIHPYTTQFFRVESGIGKAEFNGKTLDLFDGATLVVPPGARHNIRNISKKPLKLYTIYSPPHHPIGLEQKYPPEYQKKTNPKVLPKRRNPVYESTHSNELYENDNNDDE